MKIPYLLDSSACIPVLRGQSDMGKLPPLAQCGIPVIVAGELWTAVKKNLATHPQHVGRLTGFLAHFTMVDFTLDAALHYAEIRAELEAKGTPIGPLDLLIAAQARGLEATLVTGNASEFRRVTGLKLLAWRPPKS